MNERLKLLETSNEIAHTQVLGESVLRENVQTQKSHGYSSFGLSSHSNHIIRPITSSDINDNATTSNIDDFDESEIHRRITFDSIRTYLQNFFCKYMPLDFSTFELIFCLIVLMIATAIERVSFKMVIDRMVPYRVVIELLILAFSHITYAIIASLKKLYKVSLSTNNRPIPHVQLFLIALLDTIQFSGLVISAAGVPPIMTIILLHISTPCIVIGSRYFYPNRKYSSIQYQGIKLILLSICIGLLRPIIGWSIGRGHIFTIFCSLTYCFSACIQGLAILYKEGSIIRWSYPPIDIHYLSAWLLFYQFIIALMLSPILYIFQDISSDSIGYPVSYFLIDFYDGILCLVGIPVYYPRRHLPYDNRYATCQDYTNIYLILSYVLSNICILYCINRILLTRQEMLGRAMSIAIVIAFFALGYYDTEFNYGYGFFGSNIGYTDIISVIILVIGMEIYGRDPEPELEPINLYEIAAQSELLNQVT